MWLCGTNVEFKYRSIFREEVGKVFVWNWMAKPADTITNSVPFAKYGI
jgi:hypothetical protein